MSPEKFLHLATKWPSDTLILTHLFKCKKPKTCMYEAHNWHEILFSKFLDAILKRSAENKILT